jgi:acetate kinase
MKILIINSGSSSLKYQLFEMNDTIVLASGLIERIGDEIGKITHKTNKEKITKEEKIPNHKIAIEYMIQLLIDQSTGVIQDKSDIKAIGHRVVHGGEKFSQPTIIDKNVLNAIKENISLAPLHNPANLTGIEACESNFPNTTQVAVFDTAFHQSIPQKAYMYAIDKFLYQNHLVRRYGFHGTSHKYVSQKASTFLNIPIDQFNCITIHLGNGASISAISNGKSIDTSMGMTPLEGLVMGTRSGDIDPGIIFYLSNHLNMTISDIDNLLNKNSGLKGLCGTNDMRDLLNLRNEGNKDADLAFQIYSYRIKKYIGSYTAVLNRLNAIIFTGGIGENSEVIRKEICSNLEFIGIEIDNLKNQEKNSNEREIQSNSSKVKILVVPTNEELQIALETRELTKL